MKKYAYFARQIAAQSKIIICLLSCLFYLTISSSAQTTENLPQPLRFTENTLTNFGFGLDLEPTILPNGDLLFSISLLENGMYHSKYLGKSQHGAITYQRPTRLTDFSTKYGMGKTLHIEGTQPDFFMTDKATGHWMHFDYNVQNPLAISNPIPITVNGNNMIGDFTIINTSEGVFLLKNSRVNDGTNYWPGKKSPWGYPPNPLIGFNKGYDANGVWLGDKSTVVINYAKLIDKENWKFGPFKPLKINGEVFKILHYGGIRLSTVEMLAANEQQLLILSDVENASLFSLEQRNGDIELVQRQLPQGFSAKTKEVYWCSSASLVKEVSSKEKSFIVGGNPGILMEYYYENNQWKERPVLIKGGDLYVQTLAVPNYIDWDGDGVLDIISGDASGYVWFFKNKGTNHAPNWQEGVKLSASGNIIHHQGGERGSIQGPNEKRWGYTQPLVTDWNNDGLLDIVCNDITGNYVVYHNIGTGTKPQLAAAKAIMFNASPFKAAWRSKPGIMPKVFNQGHNSDKLPMLLAINGEGIVCGYERTKALPNVLKSEKALIDIEGKPLRIVGFAGHEGRATLNICDVNNDGVWDILFGQGVHMFQSRVVKNAKEYSTAYALINKGTNENPKFDSPKALFQSNGNEINLDRHGCWISPTLDDKGRLVDMLAGGENGKFYLFKNPKIYLAAEPSLEVNPQKEYGSTGKIEFIYKGNSVTYTTVRAKDGNIWLQQNLGSSRVATASNDSQSFGDYFNWGRWDDGHQYQASTLQGVPAPNNPLGLNAGANPFYWNTASPYWWAAGALTDTWNASSPKDVGPTSGCDPCKKLLGENWKVPSELEFAALKTAEAIDTRNDGFSSNLKIPFTKYASSTGANTFFSAQSRLWTNNAAANGSARYFSLPGDGSTTTFGAASRAGAYTIRCIKLSSIAQVKLTSFKGENKEGYNKISWIAESRVENSSFKLYRSIDGQSFNLIATIHQEEELANYSYVDYFTTTDEIHYKLEYVEPDGTITPLESLLVKPLLTNTKFNLVVKENTIEINSSVESIAKVKKVNVFNSIGANIKSKMSTSGDKIIINKSANKGMYTAQLLFNNGESKVIKYVE